MKKLTVEQFIADLGTNKPYPGGGSVSSLVGALSVSLSSMAASYTVNSKRYAELREDMEEVISKCANLSSELLDLMNEDAACFMPLAEAYKLPKDLKGRDEIYQSALMTAMSAPLKIFDKIIEGIDLSLYMYENGSHMLKSDSQCALILGIAALECAGVIVKVNSSQLNDVSLRNKIEGHLNEKIAEYKKKGELL